MCHRHNNEAYSCHALNAKVLSGHAIQIVARESAEMTAHLTSSVSTGASSRYFIRTHFQTHAMGTTDFVAKFLIFILRNIKLPWSLGRNVRSFHAQLKFGYSEIGIALPAAIRLLTIARENGLLFDANRISQNRVLTLLLTTSAAAPG